MPGECGLAPAQHTRVVERMAQVQTMQAVQVAVGAQCQHHRRADERGSRQATPQQLSSSRVCAPPAHAPGA